MEKTGRCAKEEVNARLLAPPCLSYKHIPNTLLHTLMTVTSWSVSRTYIYMYSLFYAVSILIRQSEAISECYRSGSTRKGRQARPG